jgi:hypothetical protein
MAIGPALVRALFGCGMPRANAGAKNAQTDAILVIAGLADIDGEVAFVIVVAPEPI